MHCVLMFLYSRVSKGSEPSILLPLLSVAKDSYVLEQGVYRPFLSAQRQRPEATQLVRDQLEPGPEALTSIPMPLRWGSRPQDAPASRQPQLPASEDAASLFHQLHTHSSASPD